MRPHEGRRDHRDRRRPRRSHLRARLLRLAAMIDGVKSRLLRWLSVPLRQNWEWTIPATLIATATALAVAIVGGSWWDGP